ncbi:MAG: hypothetical protein H6867_09865 [Rhodospirillales bacterium]|nr:hypothetical protein [Rhodospirillales bacterium]MCB9995911.1 hypothetical protein [Rhodospirillales bacterium]
MTQPSGVQKAIDKLLTDYQQMADQEKAQAPLREAARQKIDSLVSDLAAVGSYDENKVSDEMLAAFAIFRQGVMQKMMAGDPSAQMEMAQFSEPFQKEIENVFAGLRQDREKGQAISDAARALTKDMQPPRIRQGMPMIDIAVDEPEEEYGEWNFAVVAVEIDENFKARLVEKANFDLYLSAYITPSEGLTGKFNIPGHYFKAGEKLEPVTASRETKPGDQQTVLHVKGHIYQDGNYTQPLDFPAIPLQKKDPHEMDMESLLKMLQNGGGRPPGGPGGLH